MDTTLKSVQPFTLPTGIQLDPDQLCDSFGVAARIASPAVQGVVAIRGMALDFGYTVVCAYAGPCAGLKRKFVPL
jgi:hypothetical protein